MADESTTPKIQIDSDWKAEAQREKERLAKKDQAKAPGSKSGAPGRESQELPEASFKSLVGMLASQAVMGLGALADPQSGRIVIDLEGARFAIDMLDVIEQKTKGNLDDDEAKELRQVLAELRQRFVQISQFVARQMAAQATSEAAAAAGDAKSKP